MQAKSISDPRAEIAYMDDDGAIYLPPFDKELQEITRVDYTNGNDEEQCSPHQTYQFTQDPNRNIVRDIMSKSQLGAQSTDASKNDQITLKADSESTIDNIQEGLPLDEDIDELGQPKYILLTLFGHLK